MNINLRIALASSLASMLIAGVGHAQQAALPPIPNLAGKVLTVHGPIEPQMVGQTLMHEHIFIDFQSPVPRKHSSDPVDEARYEEPLALANLNAVRSGRQSTRENGFLGDFEESKAEVLEFRKWGGQTIVDVSNIGLGRDPRALWQMSNATGLSIVMGAGWYQKRFHPLDMDKRTVEELTDRIVRDIVVGVDGTDIRSGVIGEVGIEGNPLTPNEIKSTRASARASRLTGAPITFHVGGYWEEKFKVLDVVESEGVDLSRVIMGHSGELVDDVPFMKRLLARGVFIEFDYFGVIVGGSSLRRDRNDMSVAKGIMALIKAGYVDRILLGHDICTKVQLKKYGGTGFSFISEYFIPELRALGATEADIHKIMVENPQRALTFVAPQLLAAAKAPG